VPSVHDPEWSRCFGHDRLFGLADDKAVRQRQILDYLDSDTKMQAAVEQALTAQISAFEVLTPPNPDYRELVKAIAVPSLLVIGDNGVVSVETARELQGLNQHLRHEVIANAGHGLPYDKPDEFAAVVRSFLATEIA